MIVSNHRRPHHGEIGRVVRLRMRSREEMDLVRSRYPNRPPHILLKLSFLLAKEYMISGFACLI